MVTDAFIDQLVELVDSQQAAEIVVSQIEAEELPEVTAALRQRALFYLRRDAPLALAIADLLLKIAVWRDTPRTRAVGLQTKAIALTLSQREYEAALDLFAEAETIYQKNEDELDIALGQISRIWALACLQRYDEAFSTGDRTAQIFTKYNDYLSLAALSNNLAAIYGRRGQDLEALDRIYQVEDAYSRLGEEGRLRLPLALINRAIVLRNLGRFSESIEANERALAMAVEFSQTANAARAEQNLGITYFLIGRINEAHALLEKARDTFISDQRYRDAILVDLFISDGLLHLRRYEDVLAICRQVREIFQEAGTSFEVAQALINEATALTGLQAYDEALDALNKAHLIFAGEANEAWQVYTDLEEAAILYRLRRFKAAEQFAAACARTLHGLNLPLKEGLALIILAKAIIADGRPAEALPYIDQAGTIAQSLDVPALAYQVYYLRGQVAAAQGARARALAAYDSAIRELERLQGQIMVEFRADFLSDKDEVYAHAVDLCLEAENPQVALSFAERAKSRSLLAMLGHHIELRIEAKSPADQPLVDKILALREMRDRLYRRWETGETPGSTVNREEEQEDGQAARHEARQIILQTEDEIRALWHSLLVRNSTYAADAGLWQIQSRLDQQALGERSLLIEFFALPDGMVAFLVSAEEIRAVRLPVSMEAIGSQQQKLHHNFNTLKQAPYLAEALTGKALQILSNLYRALVAPWIELAEGYERLVIVPHGSLHYLPFHALYDGQMYLLQRFQVSYLPGSSFLGRRRAPAPIPCRALVMGHTQNGRLSHVPAEVEMVSRTLNCPAYLNSGATRTRFQQDAPSCQVIHLAAHGDFRPLNPLFSGLHLNDGLLTTLDVFNCRLNASLVTLSACQTGRNIIRGGDELFGLTRAFLASGAESLILTLWPVEDQTTTKLMSYFYGDLMAGQDKVASLQRAQIRLVAGNEGAAAAHPYYWAPFFLVGDTGQL